MQNIILTQLSVLELKEIFRETLDDYFANRQNPAVQSETDEIGGINLAVEIIGKAKPTIYAMVSNRQIPHSKRGKQLYFSRNELLKWLADGKRRTQAEIAANAAKISS